MNRRGFFRRVGGVAAVPAAAIAVAYSPKATPAVPKFVDGEMLTAQKLNDAFSVVINGNVLVRGEVIITNQKQEGDYVALFKPTHGR